MTALYATTVIALPHLGYGATLGLYFASALALVIVLGAPIADRVTRLSRPAKRIGGALLVALVIAGLFTAHTLLATVIMPCDFMGCWFDWIFW